MKRSIKFLAVLLCLMLCSACNKLPQDSAVSVKPMIQEQSSDQQKTDISENAVASAVPTSYMSAVWTGYDKMPFPEFLGTAMKNIPSELGVVESYEVTVTPGWPEGMDNISLEPAEGTVPVTYTFRAEVSVGGSEVEKGIIEFAVDLNETTNTFEIECIFVDGEYLPHEYIESGMKTLCLLADGEAHKIYKMESRETISEPAFEE